MANETQTCPRRMVEYGPFERTEHLDTWLPGTSFANAPAEADGVPLRSCSFCGSIHPEDFLALAEKGYAVGPTDKNYKVYLGSPHTGQDIGKFYTVHLSPEQGDRFRALYESGAMRIGMPGYFYARIYVPTTTPAATQESSDGR